MPAFRRRAQRAQDRRGLAREIGLLRRRVRRRSVESLAPAGGTEGLQHGGRVARAAEVPQPRRSGVQHPELPSQPIDLRRVARCSVVAHRPRAVASAAGVLARLRLTLLRSGVIQPRDRVRVRNVSRLERLAPALARAQVPPSLLELRFSPPML